MGVRLIDTNLLNHNHNTDAVAVAVAFHLVLDLLHCWQSEEHLEEKYKSLFLYEQRNETTNCK